MNSFWKSRGRGRSEWITAQFQRLQDPADLGPGLSGEHIRLWNFFPDPDAGQARFQRAAARRAAVRRLQSGGTTQNPEAKEATRSKPRLPDRSLRLVLRRNPPAIPPNRPALDPARVPRGRSKHPPAARRVGQSKDTPEPFLRVEFARDPAPDRDRTVSHGPRRLDHRHGDGCGLRGQTGPRARAPRNPAAPDPPRSPGISASGHRSPARGLLRPSGDSRPQCSGRRKRTVPPGLDAAAPRRSARAC